MKDNQALLSVTLLLFIISCSSGNQEGARLETLFLLKDSISTGIHFQNTVTDQGDFNILTYRNFYNGGGVAIGDINNDGLPDLYFTSNLEPNALYLNQGDLKFKEITIPAGVAGSKSWCTGVTMADVNADGYLDIYVSNSGDVKGGDKENELFMNNGDLTFTEKAAQYGLNNEGYSTQAAFFDYDGDGDLDCYLLNNSFRDPKRIELYRSMREVPDSLGGDKLYRNDEGKFTDVSTAAGIYSSAIGFGLGASVGDLNGDFLPDIYVSNDFWERDYLYLNKGDGTFSEELIDRINFCPISSMGGDIADMNNDGHADIISTDMLAADNYRLKAMSAFDPYHLEDIKYRANYHYQIGQNCFQLNNGKGEFSEIGMMTGIAATDWSWGALAFDFENDGRKDLFISNGIQRDLMYMDFRDFMQDEGYYVKMAKKESIDYSGLVSQMPSHPIANYAFSNNGGYAYTSKAEELGLGQESFSNGSAYADLDNDGDLDLVVNNSNMPVFVYENQSEGNGYIHFTFEGPSENPFGIGASVKIKTKKGFQVQQNYNTRGFQSSVEPSLLFGTGQESILDAVEVVWPDGMMEVMNEVEVGQTLALKHKNAKVKKVSEGQVNTAYENVTKLKVTGNTRHKENVYNDFDHEGLMVNMLSQESPRMVKGDVNGDGIEDFIVLGAKGDEDKLFIQGENGVFQQKDVPHFRGTVEFESNSGALYDGDGDGDLDLMIGAGGNEYQEGGKYFILRYFVNDGKGNYVVDNSNIPQVVGNFSCIEATDIDGDGDMDLFLGARLIPGNYGLPPRNFLMINERGRWVEKTPEQLGGVGMVTDASWTDVDGDKDDDLVIVGDWMQVQVYINIGGVLSNPKVVEHSSGWWNRVVAADLDGDGDQDFVLGNRGTNTKFQASPSRPLDMYVHDFDDNGKSEFIINWYPPGDQQSYPFASKNDLVAQIPSLKKKILRYEDYAQQTYETLFSPEVREKALHYSVDNLSSSILWNEGGEFRLEALPAEAQVAPVYGIIASDIVGGTDVDLWLGGNLYALQPQVGRHDASKGVVLEGLGEGRFKPVSMDVGLNVHGEVRDAVSVRTSSGQAIVVSRNNNDFLVFNKRR